ncbi:MAG: M16 family metallopeptidase [Kiritimatiellia bacterium]
MKLVLVPDDHVEGVCFGLFVASGSRHEPPALAGISHFIEHMLFKGTKTRSALDISTAIEGHGGNFNAYTSEESTCFFAHMPYDRLATAVDVISDMYANPAIPDAEFVRERGVVLEEIKMYADEPDSVASENLSRALFPKNAVGLPIAGDAATLNAMTPKMLRDYIRRAYVPRATCAVVAGRFDHDVAVKLVTDALGGLAGGEPLPFTPVRARPLPLREIRATRDVQQVQLALGFRCFGAHAPDRRKYAANVFDCLMGRTMSSRLFQSVREKRGLSYDIRSQLQFFEDVGGWVVTAGLDTARVDAALATIEREFARIRARRPSAAEMRRTKDYLLGNFRLGLENQRARMFFFGNYVLTYGDVRDPQDIVRGITAVTADDVLAVANEILDARYKSISWVTPKEK